MATSKGRWGAAGEADRIARRLKPIVERRVAARAARGGFERAHAGELVTDTLSRAVQTMVRTPDATEEAVVGWHLKLAVTDLWRRKAARGQRMEQVLRDFDFVPQERGRRQPGHDRRKSSKDDQITAMMAEFALAHLLDENERRAAMHTSARFFEKEKIQLANSLIRLTAALLTRPADRDMFVARFVGHGPEPTLQQLADANGVAVATAHSRLASALGLFDFLALHFRMLDVRIIDDLAGRLEEDPSRKIGLEDLVRAASNYARMQTELSPGHAEVASDIVRHMDWIGANLPSRRAGMPTVLRRLAEAGARYVIDPNDARHDMLSARGLHDDRQVARQVRLAIRDWTAVSG